MAAPVLFFLSFADFLSLASNFNPAPTSVIGVTSNWSYAFLVRTVYKIEPAVFLSPILSLIGSPLIDGRDPAQSLFFAKLFLTFSGLAYAFFAALTALPSGMSAPYPFKLIVKKNYSFLALITLMNEPSATLSLTDAEIGSLCS